MSTQTENAAPDAAAAVIPAGAEQLDVVLVGHVDHGKSTVIGRLLADTGSLPQGKLEQIKAQCERNSRPFEYAFLLDALKHEQAQGITIDTARSFFKTAKRHYILHDAPGHIEFLKNMVTGAARAQAALLVIDAHEGIQENSRRHGYILSLLGIKQLAVLVNKMDLVGYRQEKFEAIRDEYAAFLGRLGVQPTAFIPLAAREGANLTRRAVEMPWYTGLTALEQLDAFTRADDAHTRPLRLPVQDIYKFTASGDERRIVAGTIESGRLNAGDKVVFYPSGKQATVKSLESFGLPAPEPAVPGQAVGFTFHPQIYAKPGELVAREGEAAPQTGTRLRVSLFWLGRAPLIKDKAYKLKLGAARTPVELVEVRSLIDATELTSSSGKRQLNRHDVGECVIETAREVAFDTADTLERTSRFVIIDNHEIAGCGIILERLDAGQSDTLLAQKVRQRDILWDKGLVTREDRQQRNRHLGKLVVIQGDLNWASELAKQLEHALFFRRSVNSFYRSLPPSIAETLRGNDPLQREEHIRKLGEQARVMTEAGILFITSISELSSEELAELRLLNAPGEVFLVVSTASEYDGIASLTIRKELETEQALDLIVQKLTQDQILLDYTI